MAKADLQRGDMFVVRSAGLFSYAVLAIEKFLSQDNVARYGHSGLVVSSEGETFEALLTLKRGNMARYVGKQILVVRPVMRPNGLQITQSDRRVALAKVIQDHEGQIYPFWRLALHFIPPLAKYLADGNHLLCSELVAKYESVLGIRTGPYTGVNPDNLDDRWLLGADKYQVIYSGVW